MTKDAVATMGAILPPDVSGRDAVHVAVFSAVSECELTAGQSVSIVGTRGDDTIVEAWGETIGIVDPFINADDGIVYPGDRFWVYLYPRTITALSHRWSHPAFDEATETVYTPPSSKLESEKWLREFCTSVDCPGYEAVLAVANQFVVNGYETEYLYFNGQSAHGNIPPEFWDHVAVVLGRKITGLTPKFFTCAC